MKYLHRLFENVKKTIFLKEISVIDIENRRGINNIYLILLKELEDKIVEFYSIDKNSDDIIIPLKKTDESSIVKKRIEVKDIYEKRYFNRVNNKIHLTWFLKDNSNKWHILISSKKYPTKVYRIVNEDDPYGEDL